MSKVSPCLWFDGEAEEAANFYVSLLPDSKIETVQRNMVDGPGGNATFAVEGSGTGSGRNSLIGDCDTIATVGGQAVQAALADLATHLREQLAQAPQLRPAGAPRRGARR